MWLQKPETQEFETVGQQLGLFLQNVYIYIKIKSVKRAEQVSSLVLFIRDKETIQNIHHSIFSLNSWPLVFHIHIAPHQTFITPEILIQGDPGFNKYKECCLLTT